MDNQRLHVAVYFTDMGGAASDALSFTDTDWRMNYEVIGLLSLDKMPDTIESKPDACDVVRQHNAYTVTFICFYFHCHLEGHEVCVKSSECCLML